MKKYLIIIKFKNIEVVRMVVGALNADWATRVATHLMTGIWKIHGSEVWKEYGLLVEEIKSASPDVV